VVLIVALFIVVDVAFRCIPLHRQKAMPKSRIIAEYGSSFRQRSGKRPEPSPKKFTIRYSVWETCVPVRASVRDTIIEEIYDALIEAGTSEEKARAAARAMTNYETRISKIESDINLLKWMAGFNLAMTVAILFRVFS
jgi:hypothetical protein